MNKEIKIFPNTDSLNKYAAEKFIEIGNRSGVPFMVALAGGSTPKSLYRLLASEYKNAINWNYVFFFLGDERNVPEDHAESNFRMINENLFEPLKIPEINIFRWHAGEKTAKQTAWRYEQKAISWSLVEDEEGNFTSRFHLILLGMGVDGHTASLFPYTSALRENKRFAVANEVEKLQETRLTITFPVINNAENVMILVTGAEKAETLRKVLECEYNADKFPAQKVKLNDGTLRWLVDAEAARLLQSQKHSNYYFITKRY